MYKLSLYLEKKTEQELLHKAVVKILEFDDFYLSLSVLKCLVSHINLHYIVMFVHSFPSYVFD